MTRQEFWEEVQAEVERARAKYPGRMHRALALAGEAGEAVQAAIKVSLGHKTHDQLRAEIIQTAAMALRLAEEGDTTIGVRATVGDSTCGTCHHRPPGMMPGRCGAGIVTSNHDGDSCFGAGRDATGNLIDRWEAAS